MPRRRVAERREVLPDPIYNSPLVTKFISGVMWGGNQPSVLNEFVTTVKLYATDKGYLYFGTNPAPAEGIFDETFDPSFE